MSFTFNNKLSFIDSFQFLSHSLNSSVKSLRKNYFKYLTQEFDNNILDLVRQKGFFPFKYMSDFEKFKEELPSKEKFYSSLTMKDYHDSYLKCDILLIANVFEKFRNNSSKNYGLCPSHI